MKKKKRGRQMKREGEGRNLVIVEGWRRSEKGRRGVWTSRRDSQSLL